MMAIRKIQYAPSKQGRQPCTVVRKDFMLSPGELELEVTLDKQVKIKLFFTLLINSFDFQYIVFVISLIAVVPSWRKHICEYLCAK